MVFAKIFKKLSKAQQEQVSKTIAESNNIIKNSGQTINSGRITCITITDKELFEKLSPEQQKDFTTNKIYGGVTKLERYWRGFKIYLSSYAIRLVATAGAGAAGVLVALIPGIGWTVAGGAAGAVLPTVASAQTYPALIVWYSTITMGVINVEYQ